MYRAPNGSNADLIQVFPAVEGLVAHLIEVKRKGEGLRLLLPHRAAAVARDGVISDQMIVWIFTSENAAAAGTAQRGGSELNTTGEEKLVIFDQIQ